MTLLTSATWGKVTTEKIFLRKIAVVSFFFFLLFISAKQLFNGYSQYYFMPILLTNDYIGTSEATFASIAGNELQEISVYKPQAGHGLLNIYGFSPSYVGKPILVRTVPLDLIYFVTNLLTTATWGYILKHYLPLESKFSNILHSMFASFVLTFFFVIFW